MTQVQIPSTPRGTLTGVPSQTSTVDELRTGGTILPIVRWHHERLDGAGYPDHLRAEQLPLEVRIVTVADRFEALLLDRTDRAAVSEQEAVRILQNAVANGELDPAVVAALAAQVRSTDATR